MPVALQKPQPREKRVPKDLSRLAGKELVEEQLMKIFEARGVLIYRVKAASCYIVNAIVCIKEHLLI